MDQGKLANETQSNSSSSTPWDPNASGQPDYLIGGGGYSNESTFMSFSPLAKTGSKSTNSASYPSQQLNDPRSGPVPILDEEKAPSPPTSITGSAKPSPPPPPPPPPPLPPVRSSDYYVPPEASNNPPVAMTHNPRVGALKGADQDKVEGRSSGNFATASIDKGGTKATTDGGTGNRVRTKYTRTTSPRALPKRKGNNKVVSGNGIEIPGRFDILRGRGGLTNHHPGNVKFRAEARKLRSDYRNADTTKHQKYLYSLELVNKVKAYGGKFLEKGSDDLWHEMDETAARKKASQVLREEKWD